ncbi:MAG TPA: amidohydrolase family protein [Verrucomicrobiae bacterium]|jgi:N-acetylglucosamine-6-phosphate deacetylase|nr:amidohydrolase family protein [Verrucomicrobiae bacterium]
MQIEFPAFFDLQVNGFAGVDYNNPQTTTDDILRSIAALRKTGVTRFLPTLITSSLDQFTQCAQTLVTASVQSPAIAGIHMEGPYLSIEARGAHPKEHVATEASIDDFKRRQESAQGKIRLVTLAPEIPNALLLIEYLVQKEAGVRVAIGHTMASPEQIRDAVRAGATLSTHLGNGCPPTLPRHPNFIWEQLASDELHASLITDGHHLAPSVVKAMVRAKTPARTILVTDAIAAAGSPPGAYEFNGMKVVLHPDGRACPPGKPWMAGSALTLDRAVANAVRFTGLPIEEILPMASVHPAKYMGIEPAGKVTGEWNPDEYRLTISKVSDT